MRSTLVKVLHPVAGRPMIHYPVESALEIGANPVVAVLGHQREQVQAYLGAAFPGAPLRFALQAEQLGTAHAVLCAREELIDFDGDVFILSGDVPTLPTALIERLDQITGPATLGVVGMRLADPAMYGRLVCDAEGQLERIVEARDCTPEQLALSAVNAGIYRVDARFLFATLAGLGRSNAQGEYYLTDVVAAARAAGHEVRTMMLEGASAELAGGVNDRVDLAAAETRLQDRLRLALMRSGVTLIAPERTLLHAGVTVGPDTVIGPDVSLTGATRVGRGCRLEQGVCLIDTTVGDGVHVKAYTHAERALIEADCQVGPFARLREGTVLRTGAKVGNFVETKKTELGAGAKASHLSYLGDAQIGAGANIGAGTITCNYDGKDKFRTVVGAGAFIGSDTQLVAPVTVGDGAYVGAGTTLTEDVPKGALALSRSRQRNIPGWVERKARQTAAEGKD